MPLHDCTVRICGSRLVAASRSGPRWKGELQERKSIEIVKGLDRKRSKEPEVGPLK